MRQPSSRDQGNFVSEWFGHRLYPKVVASSRSLDDQRHQRCPFLSESTGTARECIKSAASKGVCTISSVSNKQRQDWIVCPYRAFDRELLSAVASRLYSYDKHFYLFAAPVLATSPKQAEVKQLLDNGGKVLVYFDQKMGGEISVSPTRSSPEIAFDTTFVEITGGSTGLRLERFAILEIQTMDFHGSYRKAVDNLSSALRLHDDEFPKQVQKNSRWLGERIEGPNIANVFKRTFWQLMFKFEMATSPGCSGVALAMPVAVWDSWQRFLGAPQLTQIDDALFRLQQPDSNSEPESSWIYIFDLQSGIRKTPSPLFIQKIVRTTASALAHHALDEAPKGAMNQLRLGIYPALRNRIRKFWPISVDIPLEQPTVPTVRIDEAPGDIDKLRDSK